MHIKNSIDKKNQYHDVVYSSNAHFKNQYYSSIYFTFNTKIFTGYQKLIFIFCKTYQIPKTKGN